MRLHCSTSEGVAHGDTVCSRLPHGFFALVNPGFNGSDGVDKFGLWRDFTP